MTDDNDEDNDINVEDASVNNIDNDDNVGDDSDNNDHDDNPSAVPSLLHCRKELRW